MNMIFSVYEVSRLADETLIGYFSSFEKAEKVAMEIATEEQMERYGDHIWVNPHSWGTVYIKSSPVDIDIVV